MAWQSELDRRLAFGPGLRVQCFVGAAFLLAALFTSDLRFVYVTLTLTGLQSISARLAPIAVLVNAFVPVKTRHSLSDLYCDIDASRGASLVATIVQVSGLALAAAGAKTAGMMLLAMPTASLLMAPTVGFCAGSWFWIVGRDALARMGAVPSVIDGAVDVDVREELRDDR